MRPAWLLSLCALSGCTLVDLDQLAKDPPEKRRYLLTVAMPAAGKATGASSPVLLVEQVHALAPYSGRQFVTRTGENEFAQDYYHEFLVAPGQMFSQITRQWLQTTRAFPHVIESDSPLVADAVLKLDLIELLGDYSVPGKSRARVAVRASLVSTGRGEEQPKVEFQRDYTAERELADEAPETLVRGWSLALPEVLGKLNDDLLPFGRPAK